jgi:hypothetical protein
MTEDRFEQDLRAVVHSLGPDDVPSALRERLATVTAEAPARLHLLGLGWRVGLAIAVAVIVVAAGLLVVPRLVGPAAPPSPLGALIQQTDGAYGYQMLRPADWTGQGDVRLPVRGYSDTKDGRQARRLLIVSNLEVMAQAYSSPGSLYPDWETFRSHSTLDGWTATLEQGWRHDGLLFSLIETLSNAKVFWTAQPDGSRPYLVAYVVDGGTPLTVVLSGGAADLSFEPLDQLRADGLLDGFITMVNSIRAIPADPSNVSPSLAPAAPTGPVATSAIVGSFVQQTDGAFGYGMLRPAGWNWIDTGADMGRSYRSPTSSSGGTVILMVNNLSTATHADPSQGIDVDWELFRTDSSLAGWTAGLERSMRSNQIEYTLLETLPNAKIYLTRTIGSLALDAFVIDSGQPLLIALVGSAPTFSLEPLDRLRADGLLADFTKMVESVRAIPKDPSNVSPPLP